MSIKQLRNDWSIELQDDLQSLASFGMESEVADFFGKALAEEIDRDVLFSIALTMIGETHLPSWRDLRLPDHAAELKQQLESEYEYWYEAVTSTDTAVAKQARLAYNKTYTIAETYAAVAGTASPNPFDITIEFTPIQPINYIHATFTVPGSIDNDNSDT